MLQLVGEARVLPIYHYQTHQQYLYYLHYLYHLHQYSEYFRTREKCQWRYCLETRQSRQNCVGCMFFKWYYPYWKNFDVNDLLIFSRFQFPEIPLIENQWAIWAVVSGNFVHVTHVYCVIALEMCGDKATSQEPQRSLETRDSVLA